MRFRFLGTLSITCALACGREGAARLDAPGTIRATMDTTRGARNATVIVVGLSGSERRMIEAAGWTTTRWVSFLSVTVDGKADVPIAGRYVARDSVVEFAPLFPFDAGRTYVVVVRPESLPIPRSQAVVRTSVGLPRINRAPSVRVAEMFPAGDTVPENLLRLYLVFSAPMSRAGGLEYITLLDDKGRVVRNAFLPLDADFWNREHTRYTLFMDPGRVKRGILPNEQMGRALKKERRYSIVVDSNWRDANGEPLIASYRRTFIVGAPDSSPIVLQDWKVIAPRAGSRDALRVGFPRPLDHGLLQRAIGVESRHGQAIGGTISIPRGEREWHFAPAVPWEAGDYSLLVLSILEDRAGNRIGQKFEVDMFAQVDSSPAPSRVTIPFTVK